MDLKFVMLHDLWWRLFTRRHEKLKGARKPNEQITMVFTQQAQLSKNWKLGTLGKLVSTQPEFVDTGAVVGTRFRSMDIRRTGIARWCRELQEEVQATLKNTV